MDPNRSNRPGRLGDADPSSPTAPNDPAAPATPVDPSVTPPDPNAPAPSSPTTPSNAPGPTPSAATTPSSNIPPATQAPSPADTQSIIADQTAQVAAIPTINDSCVALVRGMSASFRAAAPGNAAVAALARAYSAAAEDFGHAMTDSTQYQAPAVSPGQAQMGGTRSKR